MRTFFERPERPFFDPEIGRLAALAKRLNAVMVGTYTITTACTWTGMYNGAEVSVSFTVGTLTPTAQQQYALDNFVVPAGLATNPNGQTGPTVSPVTPAPPVTAGWVLQANGAGGTAFAAPSGAVFGSGYMGSGTLDGTTNFLSGYGVSRSGSVYTANSDLVVNNLTINPGVTLNLAGDRLYVAGTLTNNGTIWAGSGQMHASAATSGTPVTATDPMGYGGGPGGNGGTGNGTAGTSVSAAAYYSGTGGQGGNGSGHTGGAAATLLALAEQYGDIQIGPMMATGQLMSNGHIYVIPGGGAGGTGAGDGTASGGGAGAGCPALLICANLIAGTGTMKADGGNGGNATGGNAGGGGAGGPGPVLIITRSLAPALLPGFYANNNGQGNNAYATTTVNTTAIPGQTLSSSPGTEGTGSGTGQNGDTAGNRSGGAIIVMAP